MRFETLVEQMEAKDQYILVLEGVESNIDRLIKEGLISDVIGKLKNAARMFIDKLSGSDKVYTRKALEMIATAEKANAVGDIKNAAALTKQAIGYFKKIEDEAMRKEVKLAAGISMVDRDMTKRGEGVTMRWMNTEPHTKERTFRPKHDDERR